MEVWLAFMPHTIHLSLLILSFWQPSFPSSNSIYLLTFISKCEFSPPSLFYLVLSLIYTILFSALTLQYFSQLSCLFCNVSCPYVLIFTFSHYFLYSTSINLFDSWSFVYLLSFCPLLSSQSTSKDKVISFDFILPHHFLPIFIFLYTF